MFALQFIAKAVAIVIAIGVIATSQAMAGSLSLSQLTAQASQRTQGEFRSAALPSDLPLQMEKWQDVITAGQRDRRTLERCLQERSACTSAALIKWRDMMLSAAGSSEIEMLRSVNRFFNTWKYRSDIESYGKADHWATPIQFLAASGDCEDYAIAKLFSLMLLGVREDALRIVVVFDTTRQLSHAVVSYRVNGQAYILDSLFEGVVRDHEIRQYRAIFSMNFSDGWIHIPRNRNLDHANAGKVSGQSQFALLNTQIGE